MHARPARLVAALGLTSVLAVVAAGASATAVRAQPAYTPPPIGHVWVIELENKSFGESFTPTAGNQYLATTLPSEGALLRQYYGTGHNSLDNYLSLISGEAPNFYAQGDCPSFIDVAPGTPLPSGQVLGQGCVYPPSVETLANQLTAHGKTWHGYMEDLGNDPTRDNTSATDPRCGAPVLQPKPTAGLTSPADPTQTASADDQYAARHNPFPYFHALIDLPAGASQSLCQEHVGPLVNPKTHVDQLKKDLASVATTPDFSFITPNLCDDAHDSTCVGKNLVGTDQGGLIAANYWLKKYVPEITSSPAFKKDGVLVITVDEATSFAVDASSCCDEPSGFNTGPNIPSTVPGFDLASSLNVKSVSGPGISGPGGGRIGTVVISRFTRPGTVSDVPYNHYSLLRSLEDELHLGATSTIPGADGQGHLGYAGQAGLVTFHQDVFSAVPGATSTTTGTAGGAAGSGPPTTAPVTGDLAFTGADPLVPIAGGLLVAAAGGLALANRRAGRR